MVRGEPGVARAHRERSASGLWCIAGAGRKANEMMAGSPLSEPTRTLLVIGWLVAAPVSVTGQILRPTEASDRLFETLERLQGLGMLDTIPLGQRMGLEWAVREALRDGQLGSSGRDSAPQSRDVLSRVYLRELEELLEPSLFSAGLEVSLGWADVSPRSVPDNGVGEIDALIAPLAQGRGGRVLDDGANWAVEPFVIGRAGDWSFHFRPRLRWVGGQGWDPAETDVQEAWAEGPVGPLYISVGRAPLVWGPAPTGGAMLSGGARALDQVTIASNGTFRLPWIFRHYGPARASLTVARLEGDRDVPHSFLLGYKLSVKPVPSLEAGVGVLNHSWGEGAPRASFGRRILDYLVIAERFTDSGESQISNVLVGLDLRWRVPGTRGSHLYGAMTLDDFGHNPELGRVFDDNATYLVGFAVPRVTTSGRWGVRVEYRRVGITPYRHAQFTSGLTVDEILLGDAIGPDGGGIYLSAAYRLGGSSRLSIDLARERRSGDSFMTEARGENRFFRRVTDLPEERRTRVQAAWERVWPPRSGRDFVSTVRLGYEHVSNFGFEAGRGRGGALLEVRTSVGFSRNP